MKNAAKLVKNHLPHLQLAFGKLTKQEVLAGVPKGDPSREDLAEEEKSAMNNATLAYIHDKGSPAANIPARPFMEPGIKDAKDRIVEQLGIAAKRVLTVKSGKTASDIDKDLHKVGLTTQSAIRNRINAGPPPPLAESTLKARRKRGRKGTKPLIDTGQLRNSINYVIRTK